MLAQVATMTVLGRSAAGTGDVSALTTLPTSVQDNITRLGTLATALTSSVSVALTGVTNNLGTITSGVWNAGAVTSSGTVAGVAGNFSGLLTVSGCGTHDFVSAGNFGNDIRAKNTANSTTATAGLIVQQDGTYQGALRAFSALFTTSGVNIANSVKLSSDAPAGLSVAATDASGGAIRFYSGGTTLRATLETDGGWTFGAPTGGSKGVSTINTAGDQYKNGTAYTNPDYVFEHWATGKIERFIANEGASVYVGLRPLADVEAFARAHFVLPRIADWRAGKTGSGGIFGGGDAVLASIEEAYLYLFQHDAAIQALQAEVKALRERIH
jgi:hypothetical protein